ncbi:MAG: hypothetical protein H0V72_10240 [Bradyrhizobium sp.]|nr:hypothetical protein [Bradyrhizobium sp.]
MQQPLKRQRLDRLLRKQQPSQFVRRRDGQGIDPIAETAIGRPQSGVYSPMRDFQILAARR